MLTRCPDCRTVFLITAQQLDAAGGKARCGRCGVVFDARSALVQHPQASPAPAPSEPETAPVSGHAAPEAQTEFTAIPSASVADDSPVEDGIRALRRDAPGSASPGPMSAVPYEAIPAALREDFAQAHAPRRARHGWAWALVIVGLSLTLGLQYVFFMRSQLVNRFPQSRPWLVALCDGLSPLTECRVPFARNLSQLRMLSSEVAPDPQRSQALLIQATFVNTAGFTQPYPVIEVKLSDLRGQPVALRRFRPTEYLPDTSAAAQGMAPRTPVTALIEVAKPFADVNSYVFTFY